MKTFCHIPPAMPKVVDNSVRNRVESKLNRFESAIEEVHVTIKDLNGPKGGLDTRCLLRIKMQQTHDIIIEQTATKVKDAIAGALDRATQNISRQLARRTNGRRKPVLVAAE